VRARTATAEGVSYLGARTRPTIYRRGEEIRECGAEKDYGISRFLKICRNGGDGFCLDEEYRGRWLISRAFSDWKFGICCRCAPALRESDLLRASPEEEKKKEARALVERAVEMSESRPYLSVRASRVAVHGHTSSPTVTAKRIFKMLFAFF
jgi:hypothetical protein